MGTISGPVGGDQIDLTKRFLHLVTDAAVIKKSFHRNFGISVAFSGHGPVRVISPLWTGFRTYDS